jgi:hypothetical protein
MIQNTGNGITVIPYLFRALKHILRKDDQYIMVSTEAFMLFWWVYCYKLFMYVCVGSGFGGLVVSMLASGTRVCRRIFSGEKNSQHAFLQKRSKAVCPMSQNWGKLKNPVITCKLGHRKNLQAISCPIVTPLASRSACTVGDVEASGGESGNV